MASSKLSISVPDWLEPIIREAADRRGMTVSAFIVDAAKTVIIEREAAERRRYEEAEGIDRRAEVEAADELFINARAEKSGRVKGAA